MTDVRTLTDAELVQACDEYFTRIVRKCHPIGKQLHLTVTTFVTDFKNTSFTVSHELSVGTYGSSIQLKGDSMFDLADQQLEHHYATTNNKPKTITLALDAPKPVIEDAVFEEVKDYPEPYGEKVPLDDDVPF